MPLLPYKGKMPRIHETAFIAEGAMIIGDVEIGANSSVWFNAVIRGDLAPIIIGEGSSVQDNAVIHTITGRENIVGDTVSIAHGTILHGCTISDRVIVGMGAVVLDNAEIGEGSIVAAGSVVSPGKKFGPRSMIMGVPGKIAREISDDEYEYIQRNAAVYVRLAGEYRG